MTATEKPTEVHIQMARAFFGDASVHLFPDDGHLHTDGLAAMKLSIDNESIPVLIGVAWNGDHTSWGQVHLPAYALVETASGEEKCQYDYDRLKVINAAMQSLQRAKTVLEQAMGVAS